jgi:hypothetical protein
MGKIMINHQNLKFLLADGLLKPYKKWMWYDVIQPTDITVVLTTNTDVIEDVTYEQPMYIHGVTTSHWLNSAEKPGAFFFPSPGVQNQMPHIIDLYSDAIHEVTQQMSRGFLKRNLWVP